MSRPRFHLRKLGTTTIGEYLLRFTFGGVVSLVAAWICKAAGPVIGGLFLAFPALLPASITLVGKHEGRECAVDDARGARVGCIGLAAFALVVWTLSPMQLVPAWLILGAALLAWMIVSYSGWKYFLDRREKRQAQ